MKNITVQTNNLLNELEKLSSHYSELNIGYGIWNGYPCEPESIFLWALLKINHLLIRKISCIFA